MVLPTPIELSKWASPKGAAQMARFFTGLGPYNSSLKSFSGFLARSDKARKKYGLA
jgi:hypothetical protein